MALADNLVCVFALLLGGLSKIWTCIVARACGSLLAAWVPERQEWSDWREETGTPKEMRRVREHLAG